MIFALEKLAPLGVLFVLASACQDAPNVLLPNDNDYAKNNRRSGEAVGDTQRTSGQRPDTLAALGDDPNLINATYKVKVGFNQGEDKLCKGNVQMKLNPGLGTSAKLFTFPQGEVKCLNGLLPTINLAEVLSGFGGADGTDDKDNIDVADKVIGLKNLGPATFSPPRPMIPSFLAESKEALQGLYVTRQVTVTNAKESQTETGQMSLRMSRFGGVYFAPDINHTFPNTMVFVLQNQGFKEINPVTAFLFDEIELTMSLDPIAIPKIAFKGRVYDFMQAQEESGADAGGLTSGLTKGPLGGIIKFFTKFITVHVEVSLESMEGLDEYSNVEEVAH